MNFGIAMGECAPAMLACMEKRVTSARPFAYLEIGVAEGRTLFSVANWCLAQREKHVDFNWQCIGIELENGWSLNRQEVDEGLAGWNPDNCRVIWGRSQEVLKTWEIPLDFVLIDGCHEKDCAKLDFTLLEPHVKLGGYVCFHDSDVQCQGMEPQAHNNQPIGVRQALEELGLLNDTRPGWGFVEEVPGGDPFTQRGCIIVQKAANEKAQP